MLQPEEGGHDIYNIQQFLRRSWLLYYSFTQMQLLFFSSLWGTFMCTGRWNDHSGKWCDLWTSLKINLFGGRLYKKIQETGRPVEQQTWWDLTVSALSILYCESHVEWEKHTLVSISISLDTGPVFSRKLCQGHQSNKVSGLISINRQWDRPAAY